MAADVLVIGGGYSGLTAAGILANNGLSVDVLEATGHLGGRSAFDRKDGFLVDYGIHLNSYAHQGPAAAALRLAGHEIDFVSPGQPRLYMEGEFMPMPIGVGSFLGNRFIPMGEKLLIGHGVRKVFIRSATKLADVPLVEAVPGTDRERVAEFYGVLSGLGLVTPDISLASTGEFVKFLRKALRSRERAAYPRHGCMQIIEALKKKVDETGSIQLNSRVKAIDIEGGSVRSVRIKDKDLKAGVFVHSAPLQGFPALVGDALPVGYLKHCSSIVPTAGLSIDLCLNKRVSDIDGFIVTADPFTIGQFTSNIDEETAPAGKQLATFCYPLPLESMNNRSLVDAEEARLVELLERMFPGIMDDISWQRVLRLKMIDGFEPRVGQTAKDRPGVRVPYVDNLFLAGDAVGVEGRGGDVAFQAGMECAQQVMEYLK